MTWSLGDVFFLYSGYACSISVIRLQYFRDTPVVFPRYARKIPALDILPVA